MSEIDGLVQRLAVQNLLDEMRELRAKVEQVTRAQDTARTRLPESAKFELENSDGQVVARLGGSDTGEIIEYVDGPTPNPPLLEADMISAGPGQISVRSEGVDVYEDPAPKDFHALRVHVSLDSLFEPSDATAQGRLSTPKGVAGVTVDPGLWHVGLEYETKSGKLSGLSEVFEIEVEPLVDADEIQETLDEAAERLAEAEKDFQEGNEARKQEIENLRDNVIPDLESQLLGKADQSALDDLDEKIDNIDIPDLSGVPTKDQVDEAVKAAENAAKEHADLVSKGAKDDAIAEAQAKADAAKEAAEKAAKDYTDQAKADAAADAQEKADAAREHADKLVGELDFSDFAHVWRQDDPPPAGTTYEWTDGAHASPSVKRVDGEIVARNLWPNPSFEGDDNVRDYSQWFDHNEIVEVDDALGGSHVYAMKAPEDTRGHMFYRSVNLLDEPLSGLSWVAFALSVRTTEGASLATRVRLSADSVSNTTTLWNVESKDWQRKIYAIEASAGTHELQLLHYLNDGSSFSNAPPPSAEAQVDLVHVAVAASESAALAQVEEYFDGDTPDEREKDLWIDKAGLPHFWKKGWGWAVLDDERISKALNDADKAQKTADEAHSEAGEAKNQADAAMDRAGAAEDYADGLPKVLHGTSAPSGTAPDGSVWFQHQDSLSGAVVGQWNMTDGSWKSTPIDSEAIANLDVGKLTAGSANLAEAVVGKIWGQLGVFDRLDAREGWVGGVALEDGAVGAEQVNVEQLFSDEAVINKVWSDIVRARMLTAEEAIIGGALIQEGAIDVGKINVTETLTAAVAQFLEIEAGMIKANAFEGGTFTGGTFTGARMISPSIETHEQPEAGIKFTDSGIHGWNDQHNETIRLNGQDNFLSGNLYTSLPGNPGLILRPQSDRPESRDVNPTLFFSADGTNDGDNAAIFADSDWNLVLQGRRFNPGGGRSRIRVFGGVEGTVVNPGGYGFNEDGHGYFNNFEANRADFWSTSYFRGLLRNPGRPTTTASSNVHLDGKQTFYEVTSRRDSKVNIEDVGNPIAHRILRLNPRDWLDRTDLEERLGDQINLIEDTDEGPQADESWVETLCDGGTPRRVPGLVAEEVRGAGLEGYVTYDRDEHGNETLSGVAYDRLWTLLIPLVREQRDKITALEKYNADLEQRLERLEGKL